MEYLEFRVIIEDLNRIRIFKPNRQTLPGEIQMDRLREQTINFHSRRLDSDDIEDREELTVLGSYLYRTLFDDKISREFKKDYDRAQNKPSTVLRLVLEFEPDARELAEWPWEYLYYPDTYRERGFFIAARARLVLSRHVPTNDEIVKDLKPEEKPLRILIAVSQPGNLPIAQYEPVVEEIENLKTRLPSAIEVETFHQPSKRGLTNIVNEFRPHVLHFIGHGKYTEEGGFLALVEEEDKSTVRWIRDMDLADCFMDFRPRLIFLQACEGAQTESYRAFRGLALQLVYSRVPAVVAMQYPVTNLVASRFAVKFYESVGEGKPIDLAVQEGRLELGLYLTAENFSSRAFGSPVVYLQSAEGIILPQEATHIDQGDI